MNYHNIINLLRKENKEYRDNLAKSYEEKLNIWLLTREYLPKDVEEQVAKLVFDYMK